MSSNVERVKAMSTYKTDVKVCGIRTIAAGVRFNNEVCKHDQLAFVTGYGATLDAALADAAAATDGDTNRDNNITSMADEIAAEWFDDDRDGSRPFENTIYRQLPDGEWLPLDGYVNLPRNP